MFKQQMVPREVKNKQNHQNNFEQSHKKPDQKNKPDIYKKIFLFGIVFILLVSLVLLLHKQDSRSSYDAFQRDKSINRDAEGEAGVLMKSTVDRIFTCNGFTIEAKLKSTSVDREGNAGVTTDIVTKGDVLTSSHSGHYFIVGTQELNIIVDEVITDTPAEKADIKKEDQIVAIDEVNLGNRNDLIDYIQHKENLPVSLLVKRDGKEIMLSIIPEKLYGEKIGIGIKFSNTNYGQWSSESIYYNNNVYNKYNASLVDTKDSYLLANSDSEDFDNPSLSETLQWSNPIHYFNYLRFYKNPKIIEDTGSQTKIAFDVDISHFKSVDMNYYGKNSGMYDEIIEIEGEIIIDKYSKNPIQEKLKLIIDSQGSLKLHRKTINVTIDFDNFDKNIVITPPDSESILPSW